MFLLVLYRLSFANSVYFLVVALISFTPVISDINNNVVVIIIIITVII